MPRTAKKQIAPRKQPLQERSRETVAVILKGAARVFGERGYWQTTTNHVAQAAGVSIGTLYEYFPNKDALVAALIDEHLQAGRSMAQGVAERVAALEEWPPLEAISRLFVAAVTALHERDPALHQVLFEQAALAPELVEATDRLEADLIDLIADILRRHPDVDVEDPDMSAAIAVYTVEALTHKLVIHPTPGMDRDRFCDAVAKMVAGYVAGGRA